MNSITERLTIYMIEKDLNANKVTVEAGLSIGLIGKSIKNKRGLNSDTIEKILYTYKDLNAEWFVIGQGDMLKTKITKKDTLIKGNKKGNENEKNQNNKKRYPLKEEPQEVNEADKLYYKSTLDGLDPSGVILYIVKNYKRYYEDPLFKLLQEDYDSEIKHQKKLLNRVIDKVDSLQKEVNNIKVK
jgi:hypothetical protein